MRTDAGRVGGRAVLAHHDDEPDAVHIAVKTRDNAGQRWLLELAGYSLMSANPLSASFTLHRWVGDLVTMISRVGLTCASTR